MPRDGGILWRAPVPLGGFGHRPLNYVGPAEAWLRGALGGVDGLEGEEELRALLDCCPHLFVVKGGGGHPPSVVTAEDRVLQVVTCHISAHLSDHGAVPLGTGLHSPAPPITEDALCNDYLVLTWCENPQARCGTIIHPL